MNVITSYHLVKLASKVGTFDLTKLEQRQREYDLTLIANLANPFVEKIYLFVEGEQALETLVSRKEERVFPKDKLIIIPISQQPTYKDFFSYANEQLQGKICIITNSDIELSVNENWLSVVPEVNHVFALTRHETPGVKPLIDKYCCSHDSFIFTAPLSRLNLDKLDYIQSVNGSENRTIFHLACANYQLSNPCLKLITYHNHKSDLRNVDRIRIPSIQSIFVYPK